MAKVNKSAAVREALASNPDAKVGDIISSLKSRGIKVTPPLVYFVKAQEKKKARKTKGATAVAVARNSGLASPISIELISKIRSLAEEAGGYEQLRKLVDVLA